MRSAGPDAEMVGRMLDGLHVQLAEFFGRRPEGRLEVEIYATRDAYREALRRDGLNYVGGGGYYAPGTKKVYLYPQPSEYFSRQLILHEAAHQFHFLAATGNSAPRSAWYVEGLAEYFAMHRFDDDALETGVVPAVTLEDYPAKAIGALEACDWDLEGVVYGRVKAGRPLAWSLVHFLVNCHPAEFKQLARKLDRNQEPAAAWQATLGRITPEFVGEYRKWVEDHAQPWSIVWAAWQELGDKIEGHSRVVGVSVLKETPRRLEAEMELAARQAQGGGGVWLSFASRLLHAASLQPRLGLDRSSSGRSMGDAGVGGRPGGAGPQRGCALAPRRPRHPVGQRARGPHFASSGASRFERGRLPSAVSRRRGGANESRTLACISCLHIVTPGTQLADFAGQRYPRPSVKEYAAEAYARSMCCQVPPLPRWQSGPARWAGG